MLTATRAIITDTDHRRLTDFLATLESNCAHTHGRDRELAQRLNDAQIVAAEDVESDVVTMNSTLRVRDIWAGTPDTLTLVYESKTGGIDGTVPILTPLGLALLGARQGDEVDWNFNLGVARLRIEEVLFQPEANKQFDL